MKLQDCSVVAAGSCINWAGRFRPEKLESGQHEQEQQERMSA
jgi:hypothetical protein